MWNSDLVSYNDFVEWYDHDVTSEEFLYLILVTIPFKILMIPFNIVTD